MSATTRRGCLERKIQDPRSKIQGSSKQQAPNASEPAPGWILEFGSSLDLGSGILDLQPSAESMDRPSQPEAALRRLPDWNWKFGSSLDLGSWRLDLFRPFSFRPFGKGRHRIDEIMKLIGMRVFLPAATAGPR